MKKEDGCQWISPNKCVDHNKDQLQLHNHCHDICSSIAIYVRESHENQTLEAETIKKSISTEIKFLQS